MLKGIRRVIGDSETTGLDYEKDRVIELAAVEIIGNVITGRRFHTYINPGKREVHPEALKVHGLSNEFLKDQPTFAEVIGLYEEFIEDSILVFHNKEFDLTMIAAEMTRLGRPMLRNPSEDTLRQAQQMFPNSQNNLDALCRRYKIDNSRRELHGALLDSELLAEVYIEMHGLNRLDVTVDQAQGSAVDESVANILAAPARTGLIVMPSEAELRMHQNFLDKSVPKAIWKEISEKFVDTAA